MNKYQCQVCGAVSYSAASQENLKDNSCLKCDGRVEMVEGDKMNADEIMRALKEMLPPQVDYAELVCSPVPSSYGVCYVWENPEPYHISAAIDLIESLQAQLAAKDAEIERLREAISVYCRYDCFRDACTGNEGVGIPDCPMAKYAPPLPAKLEEDTK